MPAHCIDKHVASFQIHFSPGEVVEIDQLSSINRFQLNTLYVQRLGIEPKLAAADAILTPKSVEDPAFLIQITVASRKSTLSLKGLSAVQNALKAMYSQFGSESSGETAEAWHSKSPSPQVLYLVPSESFVSILIFGTAVVFFKRSLVGAYVMLLHKSLQDTFKADPTTDPCTGQPLKRFTVNFPVSSYP